LEIFEALFNVDTEESCGLSFDEYIDKLIATQTLLLSEYKGAKYAKKFYEQFSDNRMSYTDYVRENRML